MNSPYRTTDEAEQMKLERQWENVVKSLNRSKVDLLKLSIKEIVTTAYAQGLKSHPLENNVNRDLDRLCALIDKEFRDFKGDL